MPGKENFLRIVDGSFSNHNFFFELQGYVHGKKILKDPLYCTIFGSKILTCIR